MSAKSSSIVRSLTTRNPTQRRYLELLTAPNPAIVVATGPAGVAKTYIGAAVGIQKLLDSSVRRLIITRPAVSVDEDHGFLPGTLEEKMDPWMRPIYDVFHEYLPPSKIHALLAARNIEICPLAYMRGRTFDDAYILADEMQNSSKSQMQMVLTRLGRNSKLVVTGDPGQFDRGYDENGLQDFLARIDLCPPPQTSIDTVTFTENDVERHPAIRDVLRLYVSSTPECAQTPGSEPLSLT